MKTLKQLLTVIFFGLFSVLHAQNSNEEIRVIRGERPPIDMRNIPEDAYEPGVLLVKLKETHSKQLETQPVAPNKDGIVQFGLEGIDALCRAFSVQAATQHFSGTATKSGFSERHRAWGFHLWYRLEIPDKSDIISVVEAFQLVEEVAFAEPEYKKVPVWGSGKGTTDMAIEAQDAEKAWTPNDPQFNQQWHYHNTGQGGGQPGADIDLKRAWDIEKGNSNVIVAIIDDGVDFNHPDLAANMWSGLGYNFVDNTTTIIPGFHGTHVAGTVAAVSNNNIGVAGIAGGSGSGDGVRLMSCQVFRELSNCQYIAGGFEDALIYAADQGASIAQNSWVFTQAFVYNLTVMDAIDYFIANGGGTAINGGGMAIFAAGNHDAPAPFFPAAYPGVISVASTNRTDGKSYFSNYGHWVSISAPGTDVLSTGINNSYATASGTSMACPHVSGVAALVASKAYGQLTADEVKEILLYSTDNHYFVNPNYIGKLGTGRLNAFNALLETNATLNQIANPTGFKATSSDPNTILLKWNNNGNNDDVLIVWALQPINGAPVNGTLYSAGQELPGGGRVLFVGQTSQFEHTGLTASTKYHYKIWAKNATDAYSSGRATHETTQVCFPENQCIYTFRLTAHENQSWYDSYMTVEQGGSTIAELYKFCGSDFFDVEIELCNEISFQLIGHDGGWITIMGVEIIGPVGNSIYKRVPEEPWGPSPVLFDGLADCVEPTCLTPYDIEVTNNQTNQVTVQWSAVNNEELFNLEYGLWGFQPGESTIIYSINQSPHILCDLIPGKRYELRMQTDCGGGDLSFWSLPIYFETACTNFDVPLFEDFSNVPYYQLPLCWEKYGSPFGWTVWGHEEVTISHNTGKHANLVSPMINYNINQLRMYFDLSWYELQGNLYVGTSHPEDKQHTFTPVASFNSRLRPFQYPEPAKRYVVYFEDYAGNDQQIAFRLGAEDAANPSLAYIDNILIEAIPPCPEPYLLNVLSRQATAAELAWTQAGNIQEWEIKIGSIGFNPDTEGLLITQIQDNPFLINNLTPATFYEVYLRASCGTEQSVWSIPVVFSTNPGPLNLPHTENFNECPILQIPPGWRHVGEGMHNAVVLSGWGENISPGLVMHHTCIESTVIVVVPDFEVPPQQIKLSFLARSSLWNISEFEVGILGDINNIHSFHPFEVISISYTPLFNNYTVYFTASNLPNGNIAIRIQGGQNDSSPLFLDNFQFEEIPACAVSTDLHAVIIDEELVELGWTQHGFADIWDIKYGLPGFNPLEEGTIIENITQNPTTLTGLAVNSLYEFRVRAVCDEEFSEWSEPHLFATQCNAHSLPYFENFDATPIPTLPACWSSDFSGNEAYILTDMHSHTSSPNRLYIGADAQSTAWVAAPRFNADISQIRLTFKMHSEMTNPLLYVGVMSQVDDPESFQIVKVVQNGESNVIKNHLVYFTETYNANDRIVFRYIGMGGVSLDDILVEQLPECPEPFDVQAGNIDLYEATIHWLQASSPDNWEVCYEVPGFDPNLEGTTISGIESTQYTLEGLNHNTSYEIYVRALCGSEYSEWSVPIIITTLPSCQAPNNLNAASITENEATISWMPPGSASSWEVLYGIAGFNPENEGTLVSSIASQQYQLTGLQHSQYYEVYVRATCDDETSAWSAPWLFATACGIQVLPFSESFDQTLLENLPLCWSLIRTGDGYGEITVHQGHSSSTPKSLYIYVQMYYNNAFVILPKINTGNQTLKFTFKASHNIGESMLELGLIDNPSNPSSFTTLYQIELVKKWEFQEYTIYLPPISTENQHITIKFPGYGSIFLDDISIEAAPPCAPAFNLIATEITQNSAELSWSNVGSIQSFDVKYGFVGFDPETEGMLISSVIENEATLTGLTPGSYYQAYVRSFCGDEISDWSLPVLFSTECSTIAIPYHENFENLYIPPLPLCWDSYINNGYINLNSNNNMLGIQSNAYRSVILVLPEFTDSLHLLQLDILARWSDRDNYFEIGVINDLENPSSFQLLETLHYSDNQLQSKSVSFASFAGSDGRIALRFGFAAFSIDEIRAINLTQMYTITASAGSGGTIAPEGAVVVNHGDSQTFTIEAGTGYEIADVLVDGVSVGAVSAYTFDNVTDNHTIHVHFLNVTRIDAVSQNEPDFELYPNPARGQITIGVKNKSEKEYKLTFRLIELTGRLLVEDFLNDSSTNVSVSMLPPGMYHLIIFHDNSPLKAFKLVIY